MILTACTGTVTNDGANIDADYREKKTPESQPKPPPLTNVSYKIFENTEFPTSGVADGFGYSIYVGNEMRIFQPNIPVVAGNSGFHSRVDAESMARIVKYKVENHMMPPSITLHELDSAGIHY